MNGSTLTTAAPAVKPSPIHRSHSSPDLFLDAAPLTKSSLSISSPNEFDHSFSEVVTAQSDPKSTAGTQSFEVPSFDFGSDVETHLPFESKLSKPQEVQPDDKAVSPRWPSKLLEPMAVPKAATTKSSRSKSIADRPRSWLPSKSADGTEKTSVLKKAKKPDDKERTKDEKDVGKTAEKPETPKLLTTRDRSSSFADFARKSWIASSRSPSPKRDGERKALSKGDDTVAETEAPKKDASLLSPNKLSRRRLTASSPSGSERSKSSDSLSSTSRALNRASVYFGKIKQKPSPDTSKDGTHLVVPSQASPYKNDSVSPAASLGTPEKLNPRLSSQTALSSTSDTSSGGTGSTGITEPSQPSETMAQRSQPLRDPLWAAFRRLDSEFAIFLGKTSTAQRVLVARNTLIPFLRNHGNHTSNKDNHLLSPEDIDRRATILHKWWNGLLDLLDGSAVKNAGGPAMSFAAIQANNSTTAMQPVSGVDRPGLLELITFIMMRPEWRLSTPGFRPLKDRSPNEVVRGRTGTQDSTDFIAESAEHNVRTMFVNNLLTQMSIVVEKMSSRHAPVSLVTFCGKACAYAFFFIPGIAEVLVRLWGLTPDLLRRVADEFNLPRRSKGESEDIVSLFPTTLHKLGWTSVKTMTDNLRLTTKLSLVAAKIPWHGPWISRWRGGDTDLFFIFCKYYYILAEDFMPMDLPLFEKARAPAYALIHAQLLSVLDTTIHHRQAAFENMMAPNVLDSANGADAMAAALAQLPPSNLLRGMDENRLIVLLKDMLGDNAVGGLESGARQTFATAFMGILKAATKKTPVFKQAPVLVLVDFLQEVLQAFDTYAGYSDPSIKGRPEEAAVAMDHVDWNFWLDVFHKILFESNSTMSEIRILSFLYSTWDVLAADPTRKEKLCIGWLLSEEVFDKFFNNYTPMVRAYFMRLLCWRICRDQGNANELNMKIFTLVSERLKQVWSHYLWLKQDAELSNKLLPSTAPSHPQPGKRFMIIRMEMTPPQTGLLQAGFDTMNGTLGFGGIDYSSSGSGDSSDSSHEQGEGTYKKRWSIFGKMLSFASTSAPGGSATANAPRRNNSADELEAARRATATARSGPPPPPKGSLPESDASSTGSSPVYESTQFVFKFTLGALPWNPGPDMMGHAGSLLSMLPRERVLTRPRLPAPAQARVSARAASTGGRTDSPPPPAAGLPPPERMYSGLSQGGLISEARNAATIEAENDGADNDGSLSSFFPNLPPIERVTSVESNNGESIQSTASEDSIRLEIPRGRSEIERQVVHPVQPIGFWRQRATYTGRALAEWGIVVNECNSFVERRRDEGVCGLQEVEVPSLGVENLRRMG
ncbi:hypothetical protein N8I77_003949 [Diaporthe amygdali]|uniref:Uncharacterized protein n=1 Tax=Phomopsis amygdali TaxID=1214568 RepID=A0AAD9W862_PHOAM|nr:hypothetical protein N8I77_003949 [Diaporthe amygdali]